MKPAFVGGALSFKGDKKKKKSKRKHKVKHELKKKVEETFTEEELTEAEKKALSRREERETKELETVASKSHRERVEEFNEKLGNLTELNDIPRVSLSLSESSKSCIMQLYTVLIFIPKFLSFHCRSVLLETDNRYCGRVQGGRKIACSTLILCDLI